MNLNKSILVPDKKQWYYYQSHSKYIKSKHHHKSHIEDSDLSEKESQKLSLNYIKVNIKHKKNIRFLILALNAFSIIVIGIGA